jgi:hypothetical protein
VIAILQTIRTKHTTTAVNGLLRVWSSVRNTNVCIKVLRIELPEDAIIHWTEDNWKTSNSLHTKHTGLGIFVGDIFQKNESAEKITFAFFWKKANRRENEDFEVNICNKKNNK